MVSANAQILTRDVNNIAPCEKDLTFLYNSVISAPDSLSLFC